MIVQEDVPYTKEEVKAMVKTIHDLREKLSLLGWRPASEHPPVDKETGFSELEFPNEIDWQQVHIQAAIEFAAQILANHGGAPTTVAKDAVDYADALIAELKKKGGQDGN